MTLSRKTENQIKAMGTALNKSNKSQTLIKISDMLDSADLSDASLKTAYYDVKRILAHYTRDRKFLDKIKPPDVLVKRVNDAYDKRVRERKNFVITRNDVDKIEQLKDSSDLFDNIIYALFTTGRRTIEISSAEFSPTDDGQLFTRDLVKRSKSPKTDDECKFPIIWETPEFMVEYINSIQDRIVRRQLAPGIVSKNVRDLIKKRLGDHWKPHALRGCYAVWQFELNNPENINRNGYIRQVLCHTSDTSSLSYVAFMLSDDIKREFGPSPETPDSPVPPGSSGNASAIQIKSPEELEEISRKLELENDRTFGMSKRKMAKTDMGELLGFAEKWQIKVENSMTKKTLIDAIYEAFDAED